MIKPKHFLLPFFLIMGIQSSCISQSIDHWETVVYNTNVWRYFVGASEPPSNWKTLEFNDNQWATGLGGIGYGDDDDNTIISPTISLYMRHSFEIIDTSIIEIAVFHADYDDAYVAYLNGVEIRRENIGQSGNPPPHNQTADDYHEAQLYQGIAPKPFIIPRASFKNLIKEGENVLAIQVHNQNLNSSDLTGNFLLSVGISSSSMTYGNPPNWFEAPFTSSNLPLIFINTTETSEIFDEPRVPAHMGIIDNGEGIRNYLYDEFNGYDGQISIEIRGASSQSFPKKNYGFETQQENGENLNVSLLGMPKENDWVLHGPFADKSLLRNVLAYHMGEATNRYAPRTRLCELYVNGDYRGVYILTERIKRDKNRVDIAKLTTEDIEGDEITGGYILQIDRDDESTEEDGWLSTFPDYKFYAFDDPDSDELLAVQKNYIKNYIYQFEQSMNSAAFEQLYTDYVDVPSYIDYFLVTEVGKHIDAFKLSFFLYKKKESNGGKIHFGPLWDFNLGFGNFDFACSPSPDGWSYLFGQDCSPWLPFWVKKLTEIDQVSHETNCRWMELRSGPLKTETLMEFIDENVAQLEEASERNFERWPILGEYVWPNDFIGQTYEEEVTFLKDWLVERLDWMDDNMIGDCNLFTNNASFYNSASVKLFPNPATDYLTIEIENLNGNEAFFQLHDLLGKEVKQELISEYKNSFSLKTLTSGMYIYSIFQEGKKINTGKLNIVK